MRLAIISDVHGNFEAFRQVLQDIDKSRVDAVISLGDNIGYGPEPDRVIQQIQDRNIPTVLGNHELAVNDNEYLHWFNPIARKSLIMTCNLMSEPSLKFVSALQPSISAHGCRFVHGFPPESALIYVFQVSDRHKKQAFETMAERLCFIGHTHTLEIISYDGARLEWNALPEGLTRLTAQNKYIINIGSVGQPRDGSNKSKYVIWDSLEDTIAVRSISYDIAAVVKKIQAAGLPEEHARRLW
jgi:predicted phosphodiesterase